MSGFDPEAYFNTLNKALVDTVPDQSAPSYATSKQQEVAEASQRKLDRLKQIHEQNLANQQNSLVGKLGLDPDRGLGTTVNTLVSSVDGFQDMAAFAYPPVDQATDMSGLVATQIDGNKPSSIQRRVLGDGLLTGVKGAIAVPEIAVGLADMVSGGHAGKYLEEAGFRPEEAKQFLDGLRTWEQQQASGNVQNADGFWNTLAAIAENPSVVPHAVTESVPAMLSGGLLGRGLQALGMGVKGATAVGEGTVMAGSAAEGIRQQTDDGLLSPKQIGAAGATGAVGTLVNRLSGGLANRTGLGDVDEAVVAGTLGKSNKPPVPRAVGAAGLEGAEESVQSSAEQTLQNFALDRPLDQGVGNAAAMGLVTGAAMGSVMGGAQGEQKNEEKKASYNATEELVKQASQTGDASALLDPKSPTYSPQHGAKALLRYIEQPDLDPEIKQAKTEELNQVVTSLQATIDKRKAALEEFKPEVIEQMKAELETQKTDLAQLDPANTELVESTQQYIAALEKRIEGRTGEGAEQRARNALTKLETQLETVRKFQAKVTQKDMAPLETTLAQVQQDPASVAPEQVEETVSRMVTLAMQNPESLSDDSLAYLLASNAVAITEPVRAQLRQLSASRQAENALKDFGAVSDEIRIGNGVNKGIKQYRQWISAALGSATPDFETADRELRDLRNFTAGHVEKARALSAALEEVREKGGKIQVVPYEDGNWGPSEVELKPEEVTAAGGFTVIRGSSGKVEQIVEEANALSTLQQEMDSLYKLRKQGTAQSAAQKTASTQEVEPPKATTPKEVPTQTETAKPVQASTNQKSEAVQVSSTSVEPLQSTSSPKEAEDVQDMAPPLDTVQGFQEAEPAVVPTAERSLKQTYEDLDSDDDALIAAAEKRVAEIDDELATQLDEAEKLESEPERFKALAAISRQWNERGLEDGVHFKAALRLEKLQDAVNPVAAFAPVRARIARMASPDLMDRFDARLEDDLSQEEREQLMDWAEKLAAAQESRQGDLLNQADTVRVIEGQLALFSQATGDSVSAENYRLQNRVAEDFVQERRDENSSRRPLASVTDFLSKILTGETKFQDFIQTPLDFEQHGVLNRFAKAAQDWQPVFRGQLKRMANKKGRVLDQLFHTDFMQFLHDDDLNLEENISTAMSVAAFGWILESAGNPRFDEDKAINQKIGRDTEAAVPPALRRLLADKGANRNLIINRLGAMAVQALGLRLKNTAPKDSQAKLELALGAHILVMLEAQGMVETMEVSDAAVVAASGIQREASDLPHQFVRLVYQKDSLNKQAQSIADSAKGTQGTFNKVFGIESRVTYPEFEPAKLKPETHAKGMQKTPTFQWKILRKVAKHPHYLLPKHMQVLTKLDSAVVETLVGVQDASTESTHKAHRLSNEASNDNLRRGVERLMEFYGQIVKMDSDLDVPFYLTPTTTKNQRVMLSENGFNPQDSKIHRFVMRMGGWVSTVSMGQGAGDTSLINFQLRVMEGLGKKTDEQSDEATLAQWSSIEKDPVYVAAAQALRKLIWEDEVTPADQEAIQAGVRKGGEKLHSFDALMGLADYLHAKESNLKNFTSHMMGEVDGKTNGPMLSLWLLGAMTQGLAPKGGFMMKALAARSFGAWKATGQLDLYQTLASDMTVEMQAIVAEWKDRQFTLGMEAVEALYSFTGALRNVDGTVSSDARKLVKTPLTGLMYGSAMTKAIDSMGYEALDRVYVRIEKMKAGKLPNDSMAQLARDVNALLTLGMSRGKPLTAKQKGFLAKQLLPETMTVEQGMEWEFSKQQTELFLSAFRSSLGKATRASLKKNLGGYLARRTEFNTTVQAAYFVYEQQLIQERKRFEQELMDKGLMAFTTDKQGQRIALHDLSKEQETELRERVKAFEPRLRTANSKDDALDSALFASKTERHMSDDPRYSSTVQLKGFNMKTKALTEELAAPGVSAMALGIQSADSNISMTSYSKIQALNVHDANGFALKDMAKGARNLNEATFRVLLDYSLPEEGYQALVRTVKALARQIEEQGYNFDPAALYAIHDQWFGLLTKDDEGVTPGELARLLVTRARKTAIQADSNKLAQLLRVASIDQYTLEKGTYTLTEADYALIREKMQKLERDISPEIDAALRVIEAKMPAKQATTETVAQSDSELQEVIQENVEVTSPWGDLGKSRIPHDSTLVNFFENNPEPGLKDVLKVLRGQIEAKPDGRNKDFSRALWKELVKHVNPGLKIVYVTPDTAMPEGVDQKLAREGRAVYTFNDRFDTLYIKSPDFVRSGIDTEMLLHELTHAVVARTIDLAQQGKPLPNTQGIIDELNVLLNRSREQAAKDPALARKHTIALSNLQEFVAWGMTNEAFQREILNSFTLQTKTSRNTLVKAMKAFTNLIRDIVFRGSAKSEQQIQVTGLKTLFANVAGLMATAEQARSQNSTTTTLAYEDAKPDTLQVYESLAQASKPLSAEQDARLRNLIGSVMDRLQGPFGALRAELQKTQATDAIDQILQAQLQGILPFSTGATAAGISLNEQEVFALELAQLTFTESLDAPYSQGVRRDLMRLYEEARRNPQVKNALTQDQWNYVFQAHQQGERSDYLARFASLALVWEPLHEQMSFRTEKDSRSLSQMKLGEQIQWLWNQLLDVLRHRLFKVYAGQQADEKLEVLARRLVDLEYRKQNHKTGPVAASREKLEEVLEGMHEKTQEKVLKVLRSPTLDQHKSNLVRGASAVADAMVSDQVSEMLDNAKRLRDRMYEGRLGMIAGVINEMREGNKVADLLLMGTKYLETVRMRVKDDYSRMSLESFANAGKDLTQQAKDALTKVMLRTDLQSLRKNDQFTLAQIEDLLTSNRARSTGIRQFEQLLTGPFKDAYIQAARQTAYMMTNAVKGYNTQQNALAIALRTNTQDAGKVTLEEGRKIAEILDPLITLYAIEYSSNQDRKEAAHVLRTELERDDGGNGVEVILRLHRHLQEESAQKLFKDSELLMRKGYVPEVYNPHTEVVTAPLADAERMKIQGYEYVGPLNQDATDPVLKDIGLFVMRDRGLQDYQSGAVTLTGEQSKGTDVHAALFSRSGKANATAHKINRMITRQVMNQKVDPAYDPRKDTGVYMAPVLNATGEAANYRYLMNEEMKDRLLQRNNSFDHLLGVMESNIFDKSTVTEQNRKVFEALKLQYDEEYKDNPEAYVTFGPDSTDAEVRETWRKLPERTKAALKEVWGSDNLMVRNDIYDELFGYSVYSLSRIMEMEEAKRNFAEDMFFKMADYMVRWQLEREGHTGVALEDRAKRAALMIRRGEDRWKEVIKVVKDILVVKTGATLLWNIVSNFTQLYASGVPLASIGKYSWEALRGTLEYRKDESELHSLRALLASGAADDVKETQQKILRLEDSLARSPVAPLIQAGLLSAIVEDVDATESDFSYKSRFMETLDTHTTRVPQVLRTVAKYAFVTHDTPLYKVMSQGTQVSDFVARYALYQHLTTRKKKPLNHEDAVVKVSRAFINYDKPSHRMLDYMNRVGLVYFTKYYLRIQHVIMDLMKENPARLLTMVALDGYFDGAQTIVDSAAMNQFGNPLDIGAFKLFDALDEPLPIDAAISLLR